MLLVEPDCLGAEGLFSIAESVLVCLDAMAKVVADPVEADNDVPCSSVEFRGGLRKVATIGDSPGNLGSCAGGRRTCRRRLRGRRQRAHPPRRDRRTPLGRTTADLLPQSIQRVTRRLIRDDRGVAANDSAAHANYLDRINQEARNQR
jgi:hypothetical protein